MTQVNRVLAALQHGPVLSTDFLRPADGGDPIIRVAARILELREQGYEIVADRMDNRVARYTLVSAPESTAKSMPPRPSAVEGHRTDSSAGLLFDTGFEGSSMYGVTA